MTAVVGGDDRLVGRGPLVAEVVGALSGGGGAVLHGPTGVGKSAIARHVVRRTEEEGGAVLWVQGTPGIVGVPLGALLAHLVRGRDGAAPTGDADPADLAARLLRSLPGGGPLCVVDDLQWVDDLTGAVIHQLHLVDDVRLLATVREGERLTPAAAALGRSAGVARFGVRPLPSSAVADLVSEVLGGPVDAGLVDHVATRAEGNPLFVTELLAGAEGRGALRRVRGTWRLEGDLVPSFVLDEVVTSRLEDLPEPCGQGAEVLALAEQMALDHAGRCLGDDVLDELDRAGMVRVGVEAGREVVALVHPVYGEVLRARLGSLARRRHLRALAGALGDPDGLEDVDRLRYARWVLAAGDAVEPDLATAAGRLAFRTFDLDLAEQLARHSWAARPTAGAANLLAEVLHTRGDLDGSHALLAQARELASDEQDVARTVALEALGVLHGDGAPPAALELVRRNRAPMTDLEARLALSVAELYILLMSETFDEVDTAIATLEAETPAHTTVASRQLVTGALIIRGRHHAAVDLITRAVLRDEDLFVRSQDLVLMAGGVHALALLRSGRTAEAREVARRSHERCVAEGDARSRSMAASACAMGALAADDVPAAERWASDATAALDGTFAPNLECLAQALLLLVAAERGDADAARAPIAALDRLATTTERLYAAWSTKARALAMARLDGEGPAAAATLEDAAASYLALGAEEYAADLAHEAVLLGGDRLVGRDVLAAAAVDGDLVAARRRHVDALLAGDLEVLVAVGDELAGMGCAALARRVLADASALARSQGDARRARELGHRAAAGPRDAGPAPSGEVSDPEWALLTDREREVGALVARGLSSKAVATELHLSPRTVDNTLQRVYAKLGIANRRELAERAASAGLPAAVAPPAGG